MCAVCEGYCLERPTCVRTRSWPKAKDQTSFSDLIDTFYVYLLKNEDHFLINFIKNGALSFAKVRKMGLFVFINLKKGPFLD